MKKNENDILVIPSPFDVSDRDIASYLDQAHSLGTENFLAALLQVAKTKGMEQVASNAGVNRASLYHSLRPGSKPRHETIDKVLTSLGIAIRITPKLDK